MSKVLKETPGQTTQTFVSQSCNRLLVVIGTLFLPDRQRSVQLHIQITTGERRPADLLVVYVSTPAVKADFRLRKSPVVKGAFISFILNFQTLLITNLRTSLRNSLYFGFFICSSLRETPFSLRTILAERRNEVV